jgi:hypothetical protein
MRAHVDQAKWKLKPEFLFARAVACAFRRVSCARRLRIARVWFSHAWPFLDTTSLALAAEIDAPLSQAEERRSNDG